MIKTIFITVVFIISVYFFIFTNTGSGFIELANNIIKGDPRIPVNNEIVMPPDSIIEATTPQGKISIKSGKGLKDIIHGMRRRDRLLCGLGQKGGTEV